MKFTDLPKDCEEAYKNGYKTGEVMIWPTATIKPFFVYCDMELVPNHGMCIAVFSGSPLYVINIHFKILQRRKIAVPVLDVDAEGLLC